MKLLNYRKGEKLSTTYSVQAGDTYDIIAKKVYGTEQESSSIKRANPGAVDPPIDGTVLTIPILPDDPKDIPSPVSESNPSEVAILINGVRFRFWNSVSISRSIDNIDTVTVNAPFESSEPTYRDNFKPLTYESIDVTVGDQPFFTGVKLGVTPTVSDRSKEVVVSGYSKAGVIGDCTAPEGIYPLEFQNQKIEEIAQTLCDPFGVEVVTSGDTGSVFSRVRLQLDGNILPFLAGLAKQRNLIISSNEEGQLLISALVAETVPVASLKQGESPLMSVVPNISPQNYYSHITGILPKKIGGSNTKFTVRNPFMDGVVRPYSYYVSDTKDADLERAVNSKMGRMFADAINYTIVVSTWFDPDGNLWKPGKLIELEAPEAMIYAPYKFEIKSIEYQKDKKTETATISLVLPGSYRGVIPEALPWD